MKTTLRHVKALITEAFDDEKRKQIRDRLKDRRASLGLTMLKSDRHEHIKNKNHHENIIEEMENLFNEWGIGGARQELAKKQILEAVDNNTQLGLAIREHAEMETDVFESYIETTSDRAKQYFEELKKDINDPSYGIMMYGNFYTKRDLEDGTITMKDIEEHAYSEYNEKNAGMLYRTGKTGGRLESWTTLSSGAVINNVTGATFSGKMTEKHWSELKKLGYSILGGATRMMGAPGESEITIIKLDP